MSETKKKSNRKFSSVNTNCNRPLGYIVDQLEFIRGDIVLGKLHGREYPSWISNEVELSAQKKNVDKQRKSFSAVSQPNG